MELLMDFVQQIWDETWPCFYVFFGGLQDSWNIAEPFVGIECTKNESFVKVTEKSGQVVSSYQTTIYSRFLVSIPKSPPKKIAQMHKIHRKPIMNFGNI